MPTIEPSADFAVRLINADIRPWDVPMCALAHIMNATQRLIDQREESTDEDTPADEESQPIDVGITADGDEGKVLKLLEIRSGSATYGVSAPSRDLAIDVISKTGKGIENPVDFDWTEPTLSAVRELSEVAKALHCEVEIRLPTNGDQLGDVLAKIIPSTYHQISGKAFVKGRTSVFGQIERVGGVKEAHCGLRIAQQHRQLVCRVVPGDLVRQLGQYLYKDVVVSGEAKWLRKNWHLRTIRIDSFEPPKTGSIKDALKAAHDHGGHVWDKIEDPVRFLAENR